MQTVTRLFRAFEPEHYDLSIVFDRPARDFTGTVTIQGALKINAGELRLHVKGLSINNALIDGKNVSFRQDYFDELVLESEFITIGKHVVVITYSGKITDDMHGVYPCYFNIDGTKKELIATQFESHHAREAFPCIDEPEAKATFDVTITTESDVTVLGNMPVKSQKSFREDGTDRLVTTFDTTPRMSSYLVAWVFGELQKKSATSKSGVEVSIYATKAHDSSNLDFALDIASRCIDFFNDYFGVPYPLPKADHVALPDFSSGAMENWGLITYRELTLLADPNTTTLSTKHYVATVIAHELSHQWFGNLVTMKWWNDLWLNESFANMMEYVAIDAIEPSWNIWLDHANSGVVSALRRDSLDGVQSIQTDVTHPDQINSVFDPSIVYAKGGRLLRMLQAYIGEGAMRKGLKTYFERHAHQNTEANDLWQALGEASGLDVAGFMNSWMTQPGFPVVTASLNLNENKILLTQKQFFIGPHNDVGRIWPIPLHGSTNNIPETLNSPEVSFTHDATTLFRLNTGSTAHFVTHYDDYLLNEIVRNISKLPVIDRLGFLHEQTLLAKAGLQSSSQLVTLIQHFRNETEESVWSIIALTINELKKFVETDDFAESKLKKLVKDVVSVQYKRLGWVKRDGETENDTKLRSLIISLAIYGELTDATTKAIDSFSSTRLENLDPELRVAILAHAVRSSTDGKVAEGLLESYKNATNSELQEDLAAAITATRDINVIKELSKHLKNPSIIRPQDFNHWFVWLIRNRFGRTYMWQWLQDEWDWIQKTFKNDMSYDMLPRYVAGALITDEQIKEYHSFFGAFENEIALSRNIKMGYIELEGNIKILKTDGPLVVDTLKKYL